MKKLITIALFFGAFLSGCSKDDSEPAKTTYTITNNFQKITNSSDQYLDGSIYEIVVFGYNDNNDIINQDNIDVIKPVGGKSKIIEVKDKSVTKVKVSYKMLPEASPNYKLSANLRSYIVTFFPLIKGKNTDIIIDGNTMVSKTMK